MFCANSNLEVKAVKLWATIFAVWRTTAIWKFTTTTTTATMLN